MHYVRFQLKLAKSKPVILIHKCTFSIRPLLMSVGRKLFPMGLRSLCELYNCIYLCSLSQCVDATMEEPKPKYT